MNTGKIRSYINQSSKVTALLASLFAFCAAFQLTAGNFGSGTITMWGEGDYRPAPLSFPAGVTPVFLTAFEGEGGYAISSDGALYEWVFRNSPPTQVQLPPEVTKVLGVSKRSSHTLVLTDAGLYAWGANDKGQLGDGTTVNRFTTPARVLFPSTVHVVYTIAAGYLHSLAFTDDGLYAWGDNWNGELGDGTRMNRSLPVKVLLPPSVTTVTDLAAGRNDSFANCNDGLYSWGSDFTGQLGNGSYGTLPDGSTDLGQTIPGKVLLNSGGKVRVTAVYEIAAGEYYAMAITNDGLYAWGMNLNGCLGLPVDRTAIPGKVKFPKAVSTVLHIATAVRHTLAVTNDGLYAWGNNSSGQLGGSNGSDALSPIKVNTDKNALDVAAAEYVSMAIH